uniref:NADH-ubiquinone oxidoreductase chain 4 n=1 Tax=Molannodes epaphos TaxID=2904896 RepID=A0A9E8LP20_9NEOP|nr:NADH dehydrogenase subunit 4 [Molannodes epaphos]UZZ44177.1 NADH dehydrogenase subunit 4 [Molannodes epaphos]
MLKIIFLLGSMVILCFFKKMYWLVQNLYFFVFFMFGVLSMNVFYFNNLSNMFGIDLVSYSLILLSIWISSLMMMASSLVYEMNLKTMYFTINILLLLIFLVCSFSVMNLFMFYLFFESSLIPLLLLIMGWGYQPERIMAGVYLLFYTLFVSLPLLLGIFYIYMNLNSLEMFMFYLLDFQNMLVYLVLMMAFLVKLPMVFVHLWLPKAHVEAPISGSMILAAIMLKLGAYGMIRVLVLLQSMSFKYGGFILSFSLLGGIFISMLCFLQVDLKSLIAYSSVVHMSIVLGGLISMTYWGFSGVLILLIGHGLCSSGLFCLVNLNYERLMSRSLLVNKGVLTIMPGLSLWWFLLLISNMAAPPSLNLMGEVMLINSLMSWSGLNMLLLVLLSFFSAGYCLYLFTYSQHGKFLLSMNNYYNCNSREYLLLFLHWGPLNFLILKMDFMVMLF